MVLDTSVAVSWYLTEVLALGQNVAARYARWQDRPHGSASARPGMANVLRTYVRRDEIEAPLAKEIYDLHLEAPLVVREPDRAQILETALRLEATAYDAVLIGLSLDLDVPLLTAETTTPPWVVKLGDRVVPVS